MWASVVFPSFVTKTAGLQMPVTVTCIVNGGMTFVGAAKYANVSPFLFTMRIPAGRLFTSALYSAPGTNVTPSGNGNAASRTLRPSHTRSKRISCGADTPSHCLHPSEQRMTALPPVAGTSSVQSYDRSAPLTQMDIGVSRDFLTDSVHDGGGAMDSTRPSSPLFTANA